MSSKKKSDEEDEQAARRIHIYYSVAWTIVVIVFIIWYPFWHNLMRSTVFMILDHTPLNTMQKSSKSSQRGQAKCSTDPLSSLGSPAARWDAYCLSHQLDALTTYEMENYEILLRKYHLDNHVEQFKQDKWIYPKFWTHLNRETLTKWGFKSGEIAAFKHLMCDYRLTDTKTK